MAESTPARLPVAEAACGVLLVGAYAAGVGLPVDPDFDGTFGVEAYRAFGWPVFLAAAATLLAVLLVPRLAASIESAAASVGDRVPRAARVPLLVVAMTTLYVTLTDTSLSGDGMGVVHQMCLADVSASSPLSSWLLIGAVRTLPIDPRDAVRLVSCAAGAGFVALAVWAGRVGFDRAADRVATTALLVTCGSASLFFGSVEIYALPVLGTLLFLVLVIRRVTGSDGRPWPALALGVLVALHGSLLALLPVLVYAGWFAPGARRTIRSALAWVVAFAAPLAVVVSVLFVTRWGGVVPHGSGGAAGNVLGAQGQGPFLPLVASSFDLNHRYAILQLEHLVGVVNLLLLVAPVGLLLGLMGRQRGPRVTVAALAVAGLVALALVWNVSYTLRRDWDLFATIGVPLALLGALRYLGAAVPGRAARVVALALFAFVPLVLSNAGDREQRRRYADDVITTYDRIVDTDDPMPSGVRARVREWRAVWAEREAALDPAEIGRLTRAAWRAVEAPELAKAERLSDSILDADPANADGLQVRAEVLLARGDAASARPVFEEALRVAREDLRPRARRMLARIALDEGRRDDAVRHLERALREEVAWPAEAIACMERLAQVRREDGDVAEAGWLERMIERRRTTGLK